MEKTKNRAKALKLKIKKEGDMNRNHSKLLEISLVLASLLVFTAVLFISCQDKSMNPTLPTQPEPVLGKSENLAVTTATNEKIGYCVTAKAGDWTGAYPIVAIPEAGKARWPNAFAVWFPEECEEVCEVTIDYVDLDGITQSLTGTASLSTKKKGNNIIAVSFRIRTSEALYDTEYLPVADGYIADPAAGFTIHVHQDFELYRGKFKGPGPRRSLFGYISIGDVHYATPCSEWPQ